MCRTAPPKFPQSFRDANPVRLAAHIFATCLRPQSPPDHPFPHARDPFPWVFSAAASSWKPRNIASMARGGGGEGRLRCEGRHMQPCKVRRREASTVRGVRRQPAPSTARQ
ncbi:hypothetical protein SETIT_4G133400v2 [Setaria italica]|uniref:Uncharacterized protein n=1 Tax=Setaria italica TaxID=4555 RepID=A0A368QU71_SETIT|nr:hypothetical protein SETIT_4G133400v2 [Setaria italica]